MLFAANIVKLTHLELPEAILKPNTPTDTWPIINKNTQSFTSLQISFVLFQMSLSWSDWI